MNPVNQRNRLILVVVAIIVIWQLPYGQQALYPVSLLATYAHEMGHGLTALLVGGEFESLSLHADGSGLALWRGNPGRMERALVAAGGLVGPTVAGVALLFLSRSPRYVRAVLAVLALLVALSVVLWVRSLFGIGFISLLAVLLAAASRYLSSSAAVFLLTLLAAMLCLSLFKDIDYMFSAEAVVDGVQRPSDSAAIAAALWLPYWFWGALTAAFSLTLLAGGIWLAGRDKREG